MPETPCSLPRALAAFDEKAAAWDEYTCTPRGRLRQSLTMRYLLQHVDTSAGGLEVLDVGGGTGSYALPLAQLGHIVCLLDFSSHMLDIARGKVAELGPPVTERVGFRRACASEIPSLFPPGHFDLVLCHTLLEYVSDPWEHLRAFVTVLRPGALLSLLFVNAYADPLRWALAGDDLAAARLALEELASPADLFGLSRRTYTPEAVRGAVGQAGLGIVAEYGVRVFADYLPADRLAEPELYARLMELEAAAGTRHPYKLIARYGHVLASKPETV